jgi:methionyl-tRNA formyltransferase
MKILLLTPSENFLNIKYASETSFPEKIDKVRMEIISSDIFRTDKEITGKDIQTIKPDILISYGYKVILKKDVLELMDNRAINFHLSYLPWNKGIDPIFWSQFDNTITGVSIHYMDEGIDNGPIIARKIVNLPENSTLRSAYKLLRYEAEKLFYELWHKIISGNAPRIKQEEEGSYHFKEDIEKWKFLLTEDIDTPLKKIRDYGIKERNKS